MIDENKQGEKNRKKEVRKEKNEKKLEQEDN